MQQGEVHIGHMDGNEVEVNGGDMQTLLIIDTFLSERLGESDGHRPTADRGFLRSDESLFFDEVLCIMQQHFGHR